MNASDETTGHTGPAEPPPPAGPARPGKIELWGLPRLPEIKAGDDLAPMIVGSAAALGLTLENGDIVVVTSKIVSKAEGRVIRPETIKPTRAARAIGRVAGKDPKEVQVVLDHSRGLAGLLPLGLAYKFAGATPFWGDPDRVREAVSRERSLFLTVSPAGGLITDAGVDCSNIPNGYCPLPEDPDASACALRDRLRDLTGKEVAVIVADTEFRVLRQGTTDVAVGVAGLEPIRRQFGTPDRFGRPKVGGMDAVADLVTGATALVMGQTAEGVPAALVRGVSYEKAGTGAAGLAMQARWLRLGVAYYLWSGFRLWLARVFGI